MNIAGEAPDQLAGKIPVASSPISSSPTVSSPASAFPAPVVAGFHGNQKYSVGV